MKIPALFATGFTVGICVLLVGCGGGGGGSSAASKAASTPKSRLIATTRLSRAVLAVTGLGRTITRAATPPVQKQWSMGNRIGVFFSLAASTRLVTSTSSSPPIPALDPGTGLYYTTTVNADGSGEQFLYVDQALTEPAGFFKWSKPKWATSTPGTYPATISVAYSIIAGNYSGVSGTMTITVNDPNFKNGLIELALSDSLHESASASLALSAEGISGEDKMKLSNGDSCTVSDSTSAAGVLIQVFSYPDGSTEDIDSSPDGTSTETYTNPDGTTAAPDLSGSVQPDGSDTIDSSSGDTQTVNVDPGDSGDDSGDSGGDSSGGDATDQAVIRKAAAKPSTGSAGAPPAAAQIRK